MSPDVFSWIGWGLVGLLGLLMEVRGLVRRGDRKWTLTELIQRYIPRSAIAGVLAWAFWHLNF